MKLRLTCRHILLLSFLLLGVAQSAKCQQPLKYTLNDLISRLKTANTASNRVELLTQLSAFYRGEKIRSDQNLDSSLYYARAAVALSNTTNTTLANNAKLQLVSALLRTNHIPEALLLHRQSTGSLQMQMGIKIGKFYVYRSGEQKTHLDSAERYLKAAAKQAQQLKDKTNLHDAQYTLCDLIYERGNLSGARAAFINEAEACEQSGDFDFAAECYSRWGDHIPFNEAAEKLKYYTQAKTLYARAGNKEAEMGLLKAIADIHLNTGKLNVSEQQLMQVIGWYKANGYKNLQDSYFLLSVLYRNRGNLDKALNYALLAVDNSKATGVDADDGYYFNAVAQIYNDLGQDELSMKWYLKTVDMLHLHNSELMYNSLKDLSDYYIKRGESKVVLKLLNSVDKKYDLTELDRELIAAIRGNCYLYEKNYTAAEQSYLEMMKWEALNKVHTYNSADAYLTIANFYLNRKNFDKAKYYLKKILLLPPNTFALTKVKDVYFNLARADSAKGDFAASLTEYKKYTALNDSLFNASKTKQIQELTIKYDVKQKDNDNRILRKESQLQKTQLQKARLLAKITITGIVALLIIMLLLYAYIRNRKKSELLQAQHQQEINQKNVSLQNLITRQNKLLEDKEWLIKEVHHRVKNNLQVVMSLLNTQMHYIDNPLVISALKDSQTRLNSISLIHQKLFQNDEVSSVEIKPYIIDLMKYLCETFHFDQNIVFDYQIDDLRLDVNHAIPIGLIINEAVTNIIKYAFPKPQSCLVTIGFIKTDDDWFELKVKDNGIGLPADFNAEQSRSLGMVLMRGLSNQIGGEISINGNGGVEVHIRFPQEFNDSQAEE